MIHRTFLQKFQLLFLLIGDISVFLLSLFLGLYVRHGFSIPVSIWESHRVPFFVILLLWLLCMMLGDAYGLPKVSFHREKLGKLFAAFVLWIFLSFGFFYFSPFFEITPKVVLLLQAGILFILFLCFRWLMKLLTRSGSVRFAFFGIHQQISEILSEIEKKGKEKSYEWILFITEKPDEISRLETEFPSVAFLSSNNFSGKLLSAALVDRLVVGHREIQKKWADVFFKELLPLKIKVQLISDFFEEVTEKIPIQSIDTAWFLEHFDESRFSMYDRIKRLFDILGVLVLFLPSIIISFFIALALLVERKTKRLLYKQERVKKGDGVFILYKFASMRPDAEKHGPQWSFQGDDRVTKVGKFLRKFHLDEIPQFLNILKGEMSFVGPRPERPEFVALLEKEIPYYYQRFLVKPGLSGWAQLHYPYGSTVEDALHKLQYELYYIKNRSILMDLEILLRTVRLVFSEPKK